MKGKSELGKAFKGVYSDFKTLKNSLSKHLIKKQEFRYLEKEFKFKESRLNFFDEKYYYIAFVGPYSTGKSTFINSLLKKELLPEVNEKASTAFPTYIFPEGKDGEDCAEIEYFSNAERQKLKLFYLEKIINDLNIEDKDEIELIKEGKTTDELLDYLETKEQALKSDESRYNNNFFIALRKLLHVWNENVDKVSIVSLNKLNNLTEDSDESIIIKQAKIFIRDISFTDRKDIVLVDLPGVDADNPRHYKVTEDFTITNNKSSAFIVVTSPTKLQTSGFGEYLRALGKNTSHIDKAFWVVNRCDELTGSFEGTKEALIQTVQNCSVKIIDERLFACSAKDYRDRNDTVYARSIDILRNDLSSFIEDKLEKEILFTIDKEFKFLSKKITDYLSGQLGSLKDLEGDRRKVALRIRVIENEIQSCRDRLDENLHKIKTEVSESISKLTFFDEEIMDKLNNTIEKGFENLEFENSYSHFNESRDSSIEGHEKIIRYVQDSIQLNEFIRHELERSLNDQGKLGFLKINKIRLLDGVQEVFHIAFKSKDIDATFNLKERLGGVSDVMLKSYSNLFEDVIRLTVNSELNRLKATLFDFYMDSLKSEIKDQNGKPIRVIDLIHLCEDTKYFKDYIKNSNLEPHIVHEVNNNDYKLRLLKEKMFLYLDEIKNEFDENIRICLVNHFRIHFTNLEGVIHNEDLVNDMRFLIHDSVENNNSKVESEDNKLLTYGNMYEKYRKYNE